jgi:alkanesulfonate monooxygenase SsuD/methylene tetrahydromethanopterin reductase-like flavin-dependent oxidoreductase (luciferase family)
LRLGMFMMPLHPVGRPMHAYLAEDIEKALLLDKLGYHELFIGEHYSAATEPYPSPLMLARASCRAPSGLSSAPASSTRRSTIPR